MAQEGPRYNLKAVVQQTGLKPDTLRAWERRYGLPAPERSSGGHRLYSQRDIETIKWLMARQHEGLSISRAVGLWEQLQSEGKDPLRTLAPLPRPVAQPSGATVVQLREQWTEACLAYDERQAEQVLNQAFALFSPETVAIELLQHAVSEISAGWYRGDVTVQQEHFCSSLAVRRLEALVMAAPAPIRPGRILAACPPDEQHVIGLLVLTFLLRRRGWEVVYLGANVPIEQLETTVEVIQPRLVIMGGQLLHTAATLKNAALALEAAEVPVAYGGLVFNLVPALRTRIPGHFLGEQIEAAPRVVESLLHASGPAPTAETVSSEYLRALLHFQDHQSLIEARVVQGLNLHSLEGLTHQHLSLANRELGLNIGAALALGDMDYLGADIEWITGLLKSHQMPIESLYGYFQAYHQSAGEQLDERGRPILEWLGELLSGFAPG
ncbi:MerR family transcriptional regulator [Chloroflexota bacterium]